MKVDVLIIGAGASGLMCAMEAGKRGRSVAVLEHMPKICGKVLISGGGRCNFTNREVNSSHYLSRNPHFPTSALSRFTPEDFLQLLNKHGIAHHERSEGQLFCSGSAEDIVRMLKSECDGVGVRIDLNCRILEVKKDTRFRVSTSGGVFEAESLVLATGGLAAPQLGATNFGHVTARQFGMKVTPLRPALTPLLFGPEEARTLGSLSGVSLLAAASFNGARFQDKVLFTHKGLSGPAILQISSYWDRSGPIALDLFPGSDARAVLEENRAGKSLLSTLLSHHLPARVAKTWCDLHFKPKPMNRLTSKELDVIARGLHRWEIQPKDWGGFHKAEVTLGGVDTTELSSRTMESRKVAGLYFLGEAVDVTGHLGGYNLHWAWASGHAAGQFA